MRLTDISVWVGYLAASSYLSLVVPVSVSLSQSLSPSLSLSLPFPYFSLRVWQICLSEWVSQQPCQPREDKLKILVPVNPELVNYRLSHHAISSLDVIIMIMIIMILLFGRKICSVTLRGSWGKGFHRPRFLDPDTQSEVEDWPEKISKLRLKSWFQVIYHLGKCCTFIINHYQQIINNDHLWK